MFKTRIEIEELYHPQDNGRFLRRLQCALVYKRLWFLKWKIGYIVSENAEWFYCVNDRLYGRRETYSAALDAAMEAAR